MWESLKETSESEREIVEGEEGHSAAKEHVNYPGWKAMPYVIGNETFAQLSSVGMLANLLVYLTTVFHIKSVTAVTIMNIFNGAQNMTPVLGAFLSDTYLGRYTTIALGSIASLLGMVLLALTAVIRTLHPPSCKEDSQQCHGPTASQLSVIISSFVLYAIGSGGILPCNLAFGADQFNPQTQSGSRDVDSYFNWYHLSYTVGIVISSTLIVYVQSNINWALGLSIPPILMFFSCITFFVGTKLYVRVKPEGSPFTSFAQVLVAAFKKQRVKLPDLPEKELFDPLLQSSLVTKLPLTNQFKFLDKATVITSEDEIRSDGEAADPWRLCTLQQVEMVKCVVRIIPLWISHIMYCITITQQSTYIVYQALQMDRRLGKSSFEIPAGSFTAFTYLTYIIWVPIYDRLIVPQLRKVTKYDGGITVLQRIGIGLVLSILGMLVSAFVEQRRRDIALHDPIIGLTPMGGAISSMSSLWLLPQLMLFGLSEAFGVIGESQFYYQQFPNNMRSVSGAVFYLALSIANYMSGAMVTIVHNVTGRNGSRNWLAQDLNEARLDWFYMMIAGVSALNFLYFIICAKRYRVKDTVNGVDPKVDSDRKKEKTLSV